RGRPGREVHILGYPNGVASSVMGVHYRGSGNVLWIGSSRVALPTDLGLGMTWVSPVTPLVLTTGFSGGPWLADVDLQTGRGRLISVEWAGHGGRVDDDGRLRASPYAAGAFFGERARQLYERFAN